MKTFTDYLSFQTRERQEFIRITAPAGCRLPVVGWQCEPRETTLTRLVGISRPDVVPAGSRRQPTTVNRQPITGAA